MVVERLQDVPMEWDAFVRGHGASSYCHLAGWKAVMAQGLGHESVYLAAREEGSGAWRGVLPLVRVRSPLFGHYLVSLPFLNNGGPVGDEAAVAALAHAAIAEATTSGADLLELRTRHRASANGLTASDRKITVLVELPNTPNELLGRFSHKLRSNIKKPLKEGAELKVGADQVGAFYEVYARNMHDLGTPVLPRRFFECIASTFPDVAVFAALFLRGAPISAQCAFQWQDALEMVWGSSLREYNRFKPTSYMHWAFMELAIERGLRTVDLGRCTPGSGTHHFKQQWGGADLALPWLVWSRGGSVAPPSRGQPVYRVASALWRRLPLGVANRFGPALARFLP
jgi:FemAB-related protein (PEP-CTERM system-associated)